MKNSGTPQHSTVSKTGLRDQHVCWDIRGASAILLNPLI